MLRGELHAAQQLSLLSSYDDLALALEGAFFVQVTPLDSWLILRGHQKFDRPEICVACTDDENTEEVMKSIGACVSMSDPRQRRSTWFESTSSVLSNSCGVFKGGQALFLEMLIIVSDVSGTVNERVEGLRH